ncbi:MAG: murein biosynthesis integral membrane protein MurJ [Phycisphaerales bacterium]
MTSRLVTVTRLAFIVYAAVLAYATHKPNLVIDGPVPRTDLFVHLGAFFVWTALLIGTGWTGPWSRRSAVLRAGAIGLLYAAVDESTQAIPGLNRVFAFDDMAANAVGSLLATTGALVIGPRLARGRGPGRAGPACTQAQQDIRSMAGDTRTVAGFTLASRVFGLGRDLVLVRVFGDTAVGSSFNAAFALPNMFRRLFGEGALSGAFIPRYSRLVAAGEPDRPTADAYASLVMAWLVMVTGLLTVIGEAMLLVWLLRVPAGGTTSYSVELMMLMLPLMPAVCAVAILGGMLQVRGRFAMPAAAPIVLNACIIAAGLACLLVGTDALAAGRIIAVSTLVAGALQLAWALAALGGHARFSRAFGLAREPGRATLRAFLPVVIGMGTLQINTLVDTLLAMWPVWIGPTMFGRPVPMDEASNAIVGFTQRLYQFPLGVFGIAVATAAFPQLARHATDPARFSATLGRGIRLSLFIGLPASAGLWLVREDLVRVMFSGAGGFSEDGLARAAAVLAGYACAVWAYSLNHLLIRSFYARDDTATPTRISLAMVAANVVLNLVLIWRFREAGLAWATAVTATLQTLLLGIAARRSAGDTASVLPAASRIVIATLCMSAAVFGVPRLFPDSDAWVLGAWRLAAAVALGGAAYALASWLLRCQEPRWLLSRSTAAEE